MNKKITIYTGNLEKVSGSNLTVEAEKELEKLLSAKQQIDEILDHARNNLGEMMLESNTKLIERGSVRVSRNAYGQRYAFDPDKEIQAEFTTEVKYQQVNPKSVDIYLKKNDKLPDGVMNKARKESIKIELIEED